MNELELEDNQDDQGGDFDSLGSVMSLNELCRPMSAGWRGGAIRRNRWISRSCRALQMSGPPQQPTSHPFTGTLTSQLRCTDCGFKVLTLNTRSQFKSTFLHLFSSLDILFYTIYLMYK